MAEVEDDFYTAEELEMWTREEWDANRELLPIQVLKSR